MEIDRDGGRIRGWRLAAITQSAVQLVDRAGEDQVLLDRRGTVNETRRALQRRVAGDLQGARRLLSAALGLR
ncbi:MAG: hypothetical protein IPN47_27925 [Gemmatimonadetes bacterium]|nr:hypothetical protein [Gemmatimonadota bacterium]